MSPEIQKLLEKADHALEVADYDIQKEIVEPVATLKIEEGKAFIKAVKDLLKIS